MKRVMFLVVVIGFAWCCIFARPCKPLAYETIKSSALSTRLKLQTAYVKADAKHKDSLEKVAQDYLTSLLLTEVFPSWYGTEWDFYGTSEIPGKGKIACGYFVSTTLKHVGFELERYKLAQQGAAEIASSLSGKSEVIKNTGTNTAETMKFIREKLKNGLYIMSFSNHVSFLYVSGTQARIIHSNYISDKVESEDFEKSTILAINNPISFAPILPNKKFIHKWINKSKIEIHLTTIKKS